MAMMHYSTPSICSKRLKAFSSWQMAGILIPTCMRSHTRMPADICMQRRCLWSCLQKRMQLQASREEIYIIVVEESEKTKWTRGIVPAT
uniref:Alternative protein LOC100129699 n=1 Tax=Homo sapiens TaxID=9606 RepID=L8EBI5_HUMAN|nr:alternative protein LOC100129699 [Homo sapiens]